MSDESMRKEFEEFKAKYKALGKKSKRENRMILNHVCLRVQDIDAAEQLLEKTFGLSGFLRTGGKPLEDETEISVAWLNDDFFLELVQPREPQTIGYDSGSVRIGHLSEIGFVVPDMDKALAHLGSLGWRLVSAIMEDHGGVRSCKLDTPEPSGIPIELQDVGGDTD